MISDSGGEIASLSSSIDMSGGNPPIYKHKCNPLKNKVLKRHCLL